MLVSGAAVIAGITTAIIVTKKQTQAEKEKALYQAILQQQQHDYEEEQRRIAEINAQAQLMQQRANSFLSSDPDTQADTILDAQQQVQTEEGTEEVPTEEVPVEMQEFFLFPDNRKKVSPSLMTLKDVDFVKQTQAKKQEDNYV